MTNIERVVELLKDYEATKRSVAVLRYDIERFCGVTYDEAIEALALASAEGERVQSSSISDKTARVALMFRDLTDRDNRAALDEMVSEYHEKLREVELLEYCVGLLPEKQREVIQCLYFEGVKWANASEQLQISYTALAYSRKKAVKELTLLMGARLLTNSR